MRPVLCLVQPGHTYRLVPAPEFPRLEAEGRVVGLGAAAREARAAARERAELKRGPSEKVKHRSFLCPACGAMMYEAKLLKGYPKTGPDAERLTCALHGPRGQFRHIATDRKGSDA